MPISMNTIELNGSVSAQPTITGIEQLDFDGNLLHLQTPVLLEEYNTTRKLRENLTVSVCEYEASDDYHDPMRYRIPRNDYEYAFAHMRDYHNEIQTRGPDGFRIDIEHALHNKHHGLYFDHFVQKIIKHAQPFAINTARGHSMDTIKQGVTYCIHHLLSPEEQSQLAKTIYETYGHGEGAVPQPTRDRIKTIQRYLDQNLYLGVANTETQKLLKIYNQTSGADRKVIASQYTIEYMNQFVQRFQTLSEQQQIMMGFSDDNIENIIHMLKFFVQCSINGHNEQNHFHYKLAYTGNQPEQAHNRLGDILYEYGGNSLPLDEIITNRSSGLKINLNKHF